MMSETPRWTVVTRKVGAPTQFSPTGFVGTWREASEHAATLGQDVEAWYVPVNETRVLRDNGRYVGIKQPKGAPVATPKQLVAYFDSYPSSQDWLLYAAHRFAKFTGSDRLEAAKAVLAYFASDRDGATPVTSPARIYSITLRAAS